MTEFLACAEKRYAQYLSLLDKVLLSKGVESFNETMPLPPWFINLVTTLMCRDVAICFHVHCLSPFRFMKDLTKDHSGLWTAGISFPLGRLHAMLSKGIWVDANSEATWTAEYPKSPYQLWITDPTMTDEPVTLQDISISKPQFSLDLVPASLRQREFTTRIIHECRGIDSAAELEKAISRYHKFLRLMRNKNKITGKSIPLVPTLDVDLAWHTHQLYPHSYREYCLRFVGRLVNHDDTFEKEVIGNGLRETSLAWLKAYNEPYTTKDLNKEYFTTRRKIVGIIFPPYGVVMLRVGKQLTKARMGTSLTFLAALLIS